MLLIMERVRMRVEGDNLCRRGTADHQAAPEMGGEGLFNVLMKLWRWQWPVM
jgi:hypothetical protein